MKKQLLFLLSTLFVFSLSFGQSNADDKKGKTDKSTNVVAASKPLTKKQAKAVRKKHAENLAKSPFNKTLSLTKAQRKAMAIPPDKYYETEWELTMDPVTGAPTPEKLVQVREQLQRERQLALAAGRVPGDGTDNNWIERGPNNVGGRVRAIMFDPNDATYKRVFAGGVSGGLWVNNDITTNTAWTRVNIDENLSVTAITYDPNSTSTFYLGTGESYVGGDVNGNGVWKSTDGGVTWTKIFGGITGSTSFQSAASLTINSPAGIAGEYTCYPTTAFGITPVSPITANIVLVSDNVAPASDGCETLTNAAALNGKIALIRRGSCNFTVKVKSAQNAGAVGVIMMNNISGTPVAMGGTDTTINIPSIMISQEDGDLLEAAVLAGTVSGTLNPVVAGAFTGNLVPGQQHINDIKIRNNGGVSEIYVAVGDTFYNAANQATYMGGPAFGLYKSTNGGSSWTLLTLPLTVDRNRSCPNDIEIGADNTIWLSTTNSTVYGDGGGRIMSSTNGTNFSVKYTVPSGRRTQIATSATNANKIYVLCEDGANGEPNLYLTTDKFATTPTTLGEPASDGDISATDFCRGQAFYDLVIAVDPTNDAIVYIGGINLHRSTNSGTSWTAISGWTTNTPSNVHSDQHAIVFRPGNANQAVFGNDGGVYYASTLSGASGSSTAIAARNNGLNITQFYSVGVAPTQAVSGLAGEYFAAGAQDNGTQYFGNAAAGLNSSVRSQGGDGAYTMFDQDVDKYYISNYVYNENINLRPLPGSSVSGKVIDNDTNANSGAFIAPMVLDSNLDILYSDYTAGGVFQIRRYGNLKGPGQISRTDLTNALLTASPTAFAVSPYTTGSTTLLVGTRLGKLLRVTTANATPTWTEITGSSFVGSISDVEFGASNNEIFVTMHNYNVVSIWYTKDGGVTWLNKEGNFPDIPVKAILPNPLRNVGGFATEVIIGTELGVWYCNNFDTTTPTWTQSYNGMSNVKVMDLDMRNDYNVYAATYGRGVFSGMFTNTTLSSSDFVNSGKIRVYPNPANNVINIAILNYTGDLNVEMYDINGRVVKSVSVDFTGNYSVDLNGLSTGVYVVKLAGSELNYTEKIIINN
ncbi:PA domain-containing protein [Flavobacterium channae]|uniref:PA domain-containing protein n=1 Tax=Flavobacterium channae TaxID=2897181 RepID=UPI001E316E16|nr:PA domain-containing protein [Flavobacterium channae]UGS23900.1 T9SS type A sorting domain-containing protein [Flavobacterium channae]